MTFAFVHKEIKNMRPERRKEVNVVVFIHWSGELELMAKASFLWFPHTKKPTVNWAQNEFSIRVMLYIVRFEDSDVNNFNYRAGGGWGTFIRVMYVMCIRSNLAISKCHEKIRRRRRKTFTLWMKLIPRVVQPIHNIVSLRVCSWMAVDGYDEWFPFEIN